MSSYTGLDEIQDSLKPLVSGWTSNPGILYGTAKAEIQDSLKSKATNYQISFSTISPTPRPTTGQIWPRGQGNRI